MPLSFAALSVLDFLVERIELDQVVPESVCAREDLSSVHYELVEQGLVIKDDRLAGDPTFCISATNRSQARILAKKYRQAAIQLEIMVKIEENPDRGSTADYYPPMKVRGLPVTAAEYERALSHLKDWQLIKGIKTWGGELIRPELTPIGFTALESGHAPQDWLQEGRSSIVSHSSTTYTMNNSGPVGAAQQGDHNTANVTQHLGIDAESFSVAMSAIRDMLERANLDPMDLEAAQSQLEIIEEQVEAGKPAERIRVFFRTLTNALPGALASEMADLVGQALSALPA